MGVIFMETELSETVSEVGEGYVVGNSTTSQVYVIYDKNFMRGKYVIVDTQRKRYLGLVEDVESRNELLDEGLRPEDVERIIEQMGIDDYVKYAKVKLLADLDVLLEEGRVEPPREAPPPGTKVYVAPDKVLEKVFSRDNDPRYVRIGRLAAHPNVPFYVNVNQIISRHLAILAVTGAGKSNTVTVLARRIVEKNGVIVIFDMHGEYSRIMDEDKVNKIPAYLNPVKLDIRSFVRLLNLKDAPKQELYIRNLLKAWNVLYSGNYYKNAGDMLDAISEMIEDLLNKSKLPIIKNVGVVKRAVEEQLAQSQEGSIPTRPLSFLSTVYNGLRMGKYSFCDDDKCKRAMSMLDTTPDRNTTLPSLLIKLEDMKDRYESIFKYDEPDIVDKIEKGKLNVIDLSTVDEDAADVIVSTFLMKILQKRKQYVQTNGEEGFKYPLLVVLEEAHILAPRDRMTSTKRWAARIAREGRKFGVGIVLVSQRPKGLDQDTLSQANNMIILRLVEPTDQKHVQMSSESLSEDLLKQLPSLATGEAIVIGPMAPLPALVKIDKAEGKRIGADIDAVKEWEEEEVEVEDVW